MLLNVKELAIHVTVLKCEPKWSSNHIKSKPLRGPNQHTYWPTVSVFDAYVCRQLDNWLLLIYTTALLQ